MLVTNQVNNQVKQNLYNRKAFSGRSSYNSIEPLGKRLGLEFYYNRPKTSLGKSFYKVKFVLLKIFKEA